MIIFKMILILGFFLIAVFHPSYGGVIDLEQLCKSCNGTLEVRDGGVAHCVVTTENDMECAQRASGEAYQQGVTIIPELKTNEPETSEQEKQLQIEQSNIEGKPEDYPPISEDDLDCTELILTGNQPEETIFMESAPKEETTNEITQTEQVQE